MTSRCVSVRVFQSSRDSGNGSRDSCFWRRSPSNPLARQGFSSWAVVERRTGRLIGDVGLGIFEPTGDIELGYTLARDYWGLGYASEAAKACLAAALAHLDVPRIVAVVDLENETSLRVSERIGMTRAEIIEAHGRPHALFRASRRSGE